ncbi:MAG: hypothetical protein ACXWJ4_03170 [Methyloceanibacter sp.]
MMVASLRSELFKCLRFLALRHDRLIQIVSIDSDAGLASQRAGRAAKYVRTHGYQVNEIPIASSARPAQALRSEIANRRIRTAIMGAYGHRGLRERLFGSTTSALVEIPRARCSSTIKPVDL